MKNIKLLLEKASAGKVISMAAVFAFVGMFFATVTTGIGTFIANMSTTLCFFTPFEQPRVPKCLIKE